MSFPALPKMMSLPPRPLTVFELLSSNRMSLPAVAASAGAANSVAASASAARTHPERIFTSPKIARFGPQRAEPIPYGPYGDPPHRRHARLRPGPDRHAKAPSTAPATSTTGRRSSPASRRARAGRPRSTAASRCSTPFPRRPTRRAATRASSSSRVWPPPTPCSRPRPRDASLIVCITDPVPVREMMLAVDYLDGRDCVADRSELSRV